MIEARKVMSADWKREEEPRSAISADANSGTPMEDLSSSTCGVVGVGVVDSA